MIACYCRVSTFKQKNDSQRFEIERWLKGHEIAVESVRWYEDKETGKTLDRLEFNRLQRDIFDGVIKTVIIWKLDRLSRDLRDGVNLLADWCERGIRVVSVTQQIDLSGPVGKMIASLLFGLAEIELQHRAERQAAGISVAKRNGRYRGRKNGATKVKRPERARDLRARGLSIHEIAQALGISERTAFRYLSISD